MKFEWVSKFKSLDLWCCREGSLLIAMTRLMGYKRWHPASLHKPWNFEKVDYAQFWEIILAYFRIFWKMTCCFSKIVWKRPDSCHRARRPGQPYPPSWGLFKLFLKNHIVFQNIWKTAPGGGRGGGDGVFFKLFRKTNAFFQKIWKTVKVMFSKMRIIHFCKVLGFPKGCRMPGYKREGCGHSSSQAKPLPWRGSSTSGSWQDLAFVAVQSWVTLP
jgi:hypothetical protein